VIVYGIPTECDAEELATFFSKYDGSVCPVAQVRDLKKETCICAKEPYISVKETCTRDQQSRLRAGCGCKLRSACDISAKEHYIFTKEPYVSSKAPYIFTKEPYGVATISRLLKIIGLFCKRAL